MLSYILYVIYNKSLSCGVFPALWKQSLVSPIFKNGDNSLVNNYRPVCKQNLMAKIFESIIACKLNSLYKSVIIDEQHRFVAGHSITTNLLIYNNFLNACIEKGFQVDAICTDFSKAFDTVNHSILFKKLQCFEIGGFLLLWLKSFVIGRTRGRGRQRSVEVVRFNGGLSRPILVKFGVLQGSHLSPLLFIY